VSDTTEVHQAQRTITWVARLITYLLYFYFVVVEVILAIGFFLLLFGANPTSPFVEWIYRGVDRAMKPFRGIFAPIELGTTGNDVQAVFDTSVLFAMLVYGIVVLALHALIDWLSGRMARIDAVNRERRRVAAYQAGYRAGAATADPYQARSAPDAYQAGTASSAPGSPLAPGPAEPGAPPSY
jgi:uncharacterized protein YggT (Ycf19 family)